VCEATIESLRQTAVRQAAQIEMMRGAMRRAADEIRKCDYTPARSTLLTSIASTPDQALEQFLTHIRVITELPKGELK
jgi:4-hydroxy-3-methylbut-2-enyl diphosphate reductase IspH